MNLEKNKEYATKNGFVLTADEIELFESVSHIGIDSSLFINEHGFSYTQRKTLQKLLNVGLIAKHTGFGYYATGKKIEDVIDLDTDPAEYNYR